jgi:hypothetical protein
MSALLSTAQGGRMSERSALFEVLGALDTAIAAIDDPSERRARQQDVAEMIPPYGADGAVGWYRRALGDEGPPPSMTSAKAALRDAVQALAETPRVATSARLLPHRVIGMAAVARAFPQFGMLEGEPIFDATVRNDPGRTALVLMAPGVIASVPADQTAVIRTESAEQNAIELLRRLSDPGHPEYLPHIDAYRTFVDSSANRTLLHALLRSQPAPCVARLLPVGTRRGQLLAVSLRTRACIRGVTLQQCEETFLDPSTWKDYESWCAMVPDPHVAHDRTFLEVVDFDCDAGTPFGVAVWLDFSPLERIGDSRILSYAMAEGHETFALTSGTFAASPLGPNGAVRVDEGSIKVTLERVPGNEHIRIDTTKRVEFRSPSIDETTIAILACALGYGALAVDFVSDLLAQGQVQEVPCMDAPDETGSRVGSVSAGAGHAGPGLGTGGDGGGVFSDAMGPIKQSIDQCAGMATRFFDTALGAFGATAEGTGGTASPRGKGYTADALAADVAAVAAHTIQAWARLIAAGTSIAARLAATGAEATGTSYEATTTGGGASTARATTAKKTAKAAKAAKATKATKAAKTAKATKAAKTAKATKTAKAAKTTAKKTR